MGKEYLTSFFQWKAFGLKILSQGADGHGAQCFTIGILEYKFFNKQLHLLHGIFLSQQYSCQKVYHSPT
jgi:hypothetical protein